MEFLNFDKDNNTFLFKNEYDHIIRKSASQVIEQHPDLAIEITKNIFDFVEKGAKANAGEIREHGGVKMQKLASGKWAKVGSSKGKSDAKGSESIQNAINVREKALKMARDSGNEGIISKLSTQLTDLKAQLKGAKTTVEKSAEQDLEKATYKDTPENRKLGRVGKEWGGKKEGQKNTDGSQSSGKTVKISENLRLEGTPNKEFAEGILSALRSYPKGHHARPFMPNKEYGSVYGVKLTTLKETTEKDLERLEIFARKILSDDPNIKVKKSDDQDIEKAQKYIRRTGTPGNYKYEYADSKSNVRGHKNTVVESDENKMKILQGQLEEDTIKRAKAKEEGNSTKEAHFDHEVKRLRKEIGELRANGTDEKKELEAHKESDKKTPSPEAVFKEVYDKYNAKDYFGEKSRIESAVKQWKSFLERGDEGAKKYTKEDVVQHMERAIAAEAKHTFDTLKTAIDSKDINKLKSRVRYDQPYTKELFSKLTGISVPSTNAQINTMLDQFASDSKKKIEKSDSQEIEKAQKKGYYRTLKSGKKVYVKPHQDSRTKKEEKTFVIRSRVKDANNKLLDDVHVSVQANSAQEAEEKAAAKLSENPAYPKDGRLELVDVNIADSKSLEQKRAQGKLDLLRKRITKEVKKLEQKDLLDIERKMIESTVKEWQNWAKEYEKAANSTPLPIKNMPEFMSYLNSFYGKDGVYPNKMGEDVKESDVIDAIKYAASKGYNFDNGDSMDRETVRDILTERNLIDPNYDNSHANEEKIVVPADEAPKQPDHTVAKTILQQLGGSQFTAMTGAKNFGADANKLMFKIAKNAKNVTHVSITLNGKDLYDVKYINVRGSNIKTMSESNDIYADMLVNDFEQNTGMYTRI